MTDDPLTDGDIPYAMMAQMIAKMREYAPTEALLWLFPPTLHPERTEILGLPIERPADMPPGKVFIITRKVWEQEHAIPGHAAHHIRERAGTLRLQ